MDTPGYTPPPLAPPPQGLHVRPAVPKKPKRGWQVVKWIFVVVLVAGCMISALGNLFLSAGLMGAGTVDGKILEHHISGASIRTASAKVAVVSAHDVLVGSERDGPAGWVCRQLDKAAEDDKVKAVILDVETPGGGITACDIIHNKIVQLQADGTKVVVLMRSIAASGGYYVSAPADTIIAHPTTITGSIGVIISSINLEGLLDKIGVGAVIFKSGPKKDLLSPYRPISEEEKELIQGITDEMFARFKDVVSNGRNLTPQQLEAVADGSIFTAATAKDMGLVDQIGYFEDATAAAITAVAVSPKDVAVVRYDEPPSLGDVLFSGRAPAAGLTKRLEAFSETLSPGFYYIWPGP